ncbi:hypothetical protein GCM10029978_110220 [Actinoallomurus acanthiterrae]
MRRTPEPGEGAQRPKDPSPHDVVGVRTAVSRPDMRSVPAVCGHAVGSVAEPTEPSDSRDVDLMESVTDHFRDRSITLRSTVTVLILRPETLARADRQVSTIR